MVSNFIKENYVFVLLFVLLFVFSVHNLDSIGQDIGRHLKAGEVIWQTKAIPNTNLFSFTEPDARFINHHWLSEVVLYKIFNLFGFPGLILIKVLLIFLSFFLLFLISRKHSRFWPLAISFALSMLIFIARTEVRPEIFSFVMLGFFLFSIFKAKYENNYRYLWFLPVLELLWVNLHIYFFIGPLLIAVFFLDRLANKDFAPRLKAEVGKIAEGHRLLSAGFTRIKILSLITLLVGVATFINPSGIKGALLPFNILNEYGYRIAENQTIFFLNKYFGFNISIFTFELSVVILTVALLFNVKKLKLRFFETAVAAFFIYAGFRMLRNLPLYALASLPIMAAALSDGWDSFTPRLKAEVGKIAKPLFAAGIILVIFMVVSNKFYELTKSPKEFNLSAPNGLERAVNFVKGHKIEGPLFNNFDIGGYLIWQFYPEERVFVDNRPEGYSVKFFEEIYKPMQENPEKWKELSEKYGINYIFFGHQDNTPWAQEFLSNIKKDKDWPVVYVNEKAIIFLKDGKENSKVISSFLINEKNSKTRLEEIISDSNADELDLNLTMSRISYTLSWPETSLYFADKALKIDSNSKDGYLYKGLAYATRLDDQNQELAADNIKKAIELGLQDSQYYTILGVIYMNLSRLDNARFAFKEALRIDKNNKQAKEFLDKYFSGAN